MLEPVLSRMFSVVGPVVEADAFFVRLDRNFLIVIIVVILIVTVAVTVTVIVIYLCSTT